MNRLGLAVVKAEFGMGELDEVIVSVDGELLRDIARRTELPHAEKDGRPDLAGSYRGIAARDVFFPSRLLLGEAESNAGHRDQSPGKRQINILGCGCGHADCWPLMVRIEAEESTVTWKDFANPFRRWPHDGLGPYVFERREYEVELGSWEEGADGVWRPKGPARHGG